MSEKEYQPILPFDSTTADNFTIYYPQPYVRDYGLLTPETVAQKESGNLTKYYRCKETEPVKIGGD